MVFAGGASHQKWELGCGEFAKNIESIFQRGELESRNCSGSRGKC